MRGQVPQGLRATGSTLPRAKCSYDAVRSTTWQITIFHGQGTASFSSDKLYITGRLWERARKRARTGSADARALLHIFWRLVFALLANLVTFSILRNKTNMKGNAAQSLILRRLSKAEGKPSIELPLWMEHVRMMCATPQCLSSSLLFVLFGNFFPSVLRLPPAPAPNLNRSPPPNSLAFGRV